METHVPSGTVLEFGVSVSAPADLEAGIKCVALVVADEVRTRRVHRFPLVLGRNRSAGLDQSQEEHYELLDTPSIGMLQRSGCMHQG